MIIQRRNMGGLAWIGSAALAAWLFAGTAFAQSDNYDPSSRTRISYGMARDVVASNQDATTANSADAAPANWKAAATQQSQRTYESPRAGSRDYTATGNSTNSAVAGSSRHASDANPAPRPAPRRPTRGDVVRSSYSPTADNSDSPPNTQTFAKPHRQSGLVDSMSKQFTPPENSDNSYGYRPQRARLAMVDPMGTPHSANGQPMDSVMHGGEELPPGTGMHSNNSEMGVPDADWGDSDGSPPGNCPSCGNGNCGSGCCCRPLCCLFCCDWWDEWCQDLSVSVGTQGFKGPVDQGVNGDFGFHEGINWGSPLWDAMGIGAQIGCNVEQSDLSRTNATDLHRNQYFFTAGLFHRPDCEWGWQGGLVFDYLNDSFVDTFTVSQLRGDLSYVFNCHEVGFWFTAGVHDTNLFTTTTTTNAINRTTTTYKPIDLYAFYYGHRFCNGGEGRIWGGFTGGTGALVGADFSVPITDKLSLDTGFNYNIPRSVGSNSVPPEGWNIGISLVWHPFCCSHEAYCSPYRPLFKAADNGSFMVDREVSTRTTNIPQ